jgi:hypothetical protein
MLLTRGKAMQQQLLLLHLSQQQQLSLPPS